MSSPAVYLTPQGLTAGRFLKALAIGRGDLSNAVAYCEGKRAAWQPSTPSLYTALRHWSDMVQKTPVDPNNSTNAAGLLIPFAISGDFMPLVTQASAFARLTGVRRFPPNSATVGFTSGTSAAIVDEFARVPVSAAALATVALTPKKVAGLCVVTQEVALGATADNALANDLARAVALASDIAALDPNAPSSIANGCTSFASSGATLSAIDTDLARAVNTLAGSHPDQSLANASWIMSTHAATYLATLRGSGGDNAYEDVTATGGTLLGLPVLTTAAVSSNTSPAAGTVLLVDGSQVATNNNDSIGLDASSQGSLVMDSAPPSGAQNEVSLFQTNSVALLAVRWLAVARQSANSCVAITSCSWA